MKRRFLIILTSMLLLSPFGAGAVGAATFAPSPSAQSVEVGTRFTVDLLVNPNGTDLDTVRAYVNFPEDLLRVEDVSLGPLFPRQSPGNAADNASGSISVGGFNLGGAVTQSGTFATLTFTALAAGEATVEIADNSRLISSGEEKGTGAYADATISIAEAKVGDGGGRSEAPTVAFSSITHPDQDVWYKGGVFTADWTVSDDEAVTGWLIAFDQLPETDPVESLAAGTRTKTVSDVGDGIWYFHLKGALGGGSYTDTVHRAVRVDATAPNPIAPVTPRIRYNEGDEALLEFATTDDASGIDRYELSVNDETIGIVESPAILSDLKIGDYFVEVKAVDRAGNEQFGKIGFRVYPAGTELKPEDIAAKKIEQERIDEIRGVGADKKSNRLLITSSLGVLLVLAIILSISKLRRKQQCASR
jgi:hypothetical protein